MKTTIATLFIGAAMALTTASCSDFLDQDPIDQINANKWFNSESDLEFYANGFLQSYLPSESTIGLGDGYCDLVATKTSSDYYRPGIWNSSKQTGWGYGDWESIRRVNYMLENMPRCQDKVNSTVYNHYLGVARFWRAYFYYSKVRTFGNVPWIERVFSESDGDIYAGRDDREFVMHKILEDLDFACQNLQPSGMAYTKGRTHINKWIALAFKSRVCLFEGTYRKYHTVNPSTNQPWNGQYESSSELLTEVTKAAEELMTDGGFKLYKTGAPSTDFRTVFTSMSPTATDEVIWIRECSTALNVYNEITWNVNSSTYGQQYAPTKDLMDMFLTLDGTPIATDKVLVSEEFENRDWRLIQTVHGPGHTYQTNSGTNALKALNFTYTFTGYQFIKWSIEREENYSKGKAENSLPILRLGEVLLNYAEAKAELGQMTKEIWNNTVGALRERAGVTNIYPGDAGYVEDSWLKDYYADSPLPLSNTLLEIRRERATELIMEMGLRVDDLYRWKLGNLIVKRFHNNQGWRGIYLSPDAYENGFEFNGTQYGGKSGNDAAWSKTSATSYKIGTSTANSNFSLSEGNSGYLIYNYQLEWQDKMYVKPIPDSALTLNPDLGQNYGWGEE